MQTLDWNAKAVVHRRTDTGSELHFDFDEVGNGTLAEIVRWVATMSSEERGRLVVDVSGLGNLDIQQVLALSTRADLPLS